MNRTRSISKLVLDDLVIIETLVNREGCGKLSYRRLTTASIWWELGCRQGHCDCLFMFVLQCWNDFSPISSHFTVTLLELNDDVESSIALYDIQDLFSQWILMSILGEFNRPTPAAMTADDDDDDDDDDFDSDDFDSDDEDYIYIVFVHYHCYYVNSHIVATRHYYCYWD